MSGSSVRLGEREDLLAGAGAAMEKAAGHLLRLQNPDGHWCARLTADSTLESDYILLQLWLYPPEDGAWNPPTRPRIERAARSILARQFPDGGFNIYAGGPSEISASVKAYCALKLAGIPAADPRMERLRERILALGGVSAANSYVKINLSFFGLYPRAYCPTVPPEMMLMPGGFLYEMSSWTRAIVVPLSIVQAAAGPRPAPAGFTLEELGQPAPFAPGPGTLTWRKTFLLIDRFFKIWERRGPRGVRRRALAAAERWILERFADSDGLGAIYPAMMYAIMALDALGYQPDHPARAEAQRQFDALMVEDGEGFFFQPCFSPVWDTAIAAYALAQTPELPGPALQTASEWLRAREIRRKGDWCVKRPGIAPSGWAFEYNNAFYPDIDDTAMVLLALSDAGLEAPERAVEWLLAMQSGDGGWAAFDADNDWSFLSHVPFADHNAMLDPTCPDITGRVLEGLHAAGVPREHPAVRRGVEYLVRSQEADGSWYGRWGVAYLYGTCFALRGLAASGESDREAHILRAGEWIRSIQNADGGWGESCASYDHGAFTPAPSTPSQTAWAIMGLLAGGDANSRSVQHGVRYLLRTQRPDGSWDEQLATGTGFPRVFYLNYHLYRLYFPLLALSSFRKNCV